MAQTDANDQTPEPSADVDLDEVLDMPNAGDVPAETAEPSTAAGENTEEDTLSLIRDVVDTKTSEETASPAEGEEDGEPADEPDPEKEAPEAPDDEDYSDVPFHKHPRFQQVLRQKREYQTDAEHYRNVQGFLDSNGLDGAEAAELLTIGGLMKTNPAEAWQRMRPAVEKLLQAAGEVLPEDLRERVQQGELSNEAALEVSRIRAQQSSQERFRAFEQQRQEHRQQTEATRQLTDTATTWESDRRRRDPNFDAKYDSLMDQVYALQRREGVPTSPEGVRAQLNKAYKAVAPPPVPRPKPQQQVRPTNSAGVVAGNQRPAEMSTLDLIKANRRTA